ncbi:uncharacterized protein LOC131682973 [Topomyia yanbarensis]|uniref:uncharacterized protein LOC131682973 n=1 Tax=Topomyia yanbarensis TaxID=2498891 RepID=UPI00273A8B2D|nr:uncharacterized protein LOC131682973 [Topomyia yanbarensis]
MLTEHLHRQQQPKHEEGAVTTLRKTLAKQSSKLARNPFCSSQDNLGASEYRKDRRVHGLQLPLHPLQLVGWFALVVFGYSTFAVLIPALKPSVQEPLYYLLATLYLLHLASHLAALLLDPADIELRRKSTRTVVPEFDRSKHSHVIENGRCHLCNIKTTSHRTKHCSVCNKCVGTFDHHCKWLNHCVGGRNYVAFLMCVVSAVIAALVILAAAVLEIVLYHVQPEWLNLTWFGFASDTNSSTIVDYPSTDRNNETLSTSPTLWENITITAQDLLLNQTIFISSSENTTEAIDYGTEKPVEATGISTNNTIVLAFIGFLGILAAVAAGLLIHLCCFHIYISFLGLTTYEYIRNSRQNVMTNVPTNAQVSQNLANGPSTTTSTTATISKVSVLTNCTKPNDSIPEVYVCSSVNPLILPVSGTLNDLNRQRPRTLHCCDNSKECTNNITSAGLRNLDTLSLTTVGTSASAGTSAHQKAAFYLCSMLEERNVAAVTGHPRDKCESRSFHCCSQFRQTTVNGEDFETTTTSESYVQYSEQCTFCSFKVKPSRNALDKNEQIAALQEKRCCAKSLTKHHRWKRKWNCCSNVPDSPDVPGDPLRSISAVVQQQQKRNVPQSFPTITNVVEHNHLQEEQQQQLNHNELTNNENCANNNRNNNCVSNNNCSNNSTVSSISNGNEYFDNLTSVGEHNAINNNNIIYTSTSSTSSDNNNRILNDANGNDVTLLSNSASPVPKRPRARSVRPWPVVRLRHMIRMIDRYRRPRCRPGAPLAAANIKQNQVRPLSTTECSSAVVNCGQGSTSILNHGVILPTSAIRNEAPPTMPALPHPARRKLKNTTDDLRDLADTLAFVQQQQQQQFNSHNQLQPTTVRIPVHPSYRRSRRKNLIRNRSPTLSPIHESGLSNPASPKPCRHSCSASISSLTSGAVAVNVCGSGSVGGGTRGSPVDRYA